MARRPRGACPRCGRDVAFSPIEQVPVRHKNSTGWCSGEPKSIYEVVADILDATAAQRAVLSKVVDAYIEFGDELLAASAEHTAAQARTSVLVKRATELLDELAKKRAEA